VQEQRLVITVHQDPESTRLLRDPAFVHEWAELAERCPWSTIYQTPEFVQSWLDVYADVSEPIVVAGRHETGRLCGLFLLSRRRSNGEIRAAGEAHCEYQIWIAEPEANTVYITAALDALSRAAGAHRLTLIFVPGSVPLEWLKESPAWRHRHWIDTETNAILDLGSGFQSEQLRAYRAYRQRLRKAAGLPCVRIDYCHDGDAFEQQLPAIAEIVDFRQGSKNGNLPFRDDPRKAAFHARLAANPGLIHCTLLRIEDRLASVEVNLQHKRTLIHCMLAHRPEYSRFSLGRYHMLRLAEMAAGQGVACFDLTPSGEYKDGFATRHEEAYIVRLYFGRVGMALFLLRRRITSMLSPIVRRKVEAAMALVRDVRERLSRTTMKSIVMTLARRLRNKLAHSIEIRAYQWPDSTALPSVSQQHSAVNCLRDLLAYEPVFGWQATKHEFLRVAAERLECGDTCFTRVENGVLAHYGWMGRRMALPFVEVSQEEKLEAESIVLYDFFTHPSFRGRGYYKTTLREALSGLDKSAAGAAIYISVAANNVPSRRAIEKTGFVLWGRYIERRVLQRVRRWKEPR
jgi:CelD/BcsL family acetyltransferase involved in cellulose biosynthesis